MKFQKETAYKMKYMNVLLWGIIGFIIFFGGEGSFAEKHGQNFAGNRATITHKIYDPEDSLSSQFIVEQVDADGIPLWFYREFLKQVCLSGECMLIHLRIYWDGTANYLKIEPLEPLTKSNHVQFTVEEYKKLDKILADSLSVLKGLNIEELTFSPAENENDRVDAKTGATQPYLFDLVVPNAVYSCYTIWHTVYGNTRDKIKSIIDQRINSNYLKTVFSRQDAKYLSWAIGIVDKNPRYQKDFYREIISLTTSEDFDVSQRAQHYFTTVRMADTGIQRELALKVGTASLQAKYQIIQIFSSIKKIDDSIILIFLKYFKSKTINPSMFSSVCKMISLENMKNADIVKELEINSTSENIYVRNMVRKILSELKDPPVKKADSYESP